MQHRQRTVISLGGSLIVPGESIDTEYLSAFKSLVSKYAQTHQFYLIAGGGKTARKYIDAASSLRADVSDAEKDQIGIEATKLNARLVQTIFGDLAHPEIISDPKTRLTGRYPVIVGSGYRPGNSTDYIAVKVAETNRASRVINLSNIPFAYDSDPKANKNAKKLVDVTWEDFEKVVGKKWTPGMNVPFDPIATIHAKAGRLKVIIADGRNLPNLENMLLARPYDGTTIS